MLSWFPGLPFHQAFNNRLNPLSAMFPYLIKCLLQGANYQGIDQTISLLIVRHKELEENELWRNFEKKFLLL